MRYYILLVVIGLLVWAPQYADDRFLIPLVPFITLGIVWLISKLKPGDGRRFLVACLVIWVLTCVLGKHHQRTEDWGYNRDLSEFIMESVPDSGVVGSTKPANYYLLTGRTSIRWPYTSRPDSIKAYLNRVDYLLVDHMGAVQYVTPHISDWQIVDGRKNLFILVRKPKP